MKLDTTVTMSSSASPTSIKEGARLCALPTPWIYAKRSLRAGLLISSSSGMAKRCREGRAVALKCNTENIERKGRERAIPKVSKSEGDT